MLKYGNKVNWNKTFREFETVYSKSYSTPSISVSGKLGPPLRMREEFFFNSNTEVLDAGRGAGWPRPLNLL